MDVQIGKSEEEEVTDEGISESKMRNWYQNKVDDLT